MKDLILELKNVSRKFQQGPSTIKVLESLNLTLEKGRSLAICGESGSGKTTLLSLIAGLDAPDSGDILVDNQSLIHMSQKDLTIFRAKNMGIVFQQFYLLSHLTAIENIALPLEIANDPKAEQKAKQALSLVGLEKRSNHFPSQLSGGENQRIAIARAFATQPKLLLADEPSGSLDRKTGEAVMNLLFQLSETQKTSLVLVTHSEELAQQCDAIYRFN